MTRKKLDDLFGQHGLGNVYWGPKRPGIEECPGNPVIMGIPECTEGRFTEFWYKANQLIHRGLNIINTQRGIPLSDGAIIHETLYSISEDDAERMYEKFDEIIAAT